MSGLRIEPFLISLENNKNVKDICIFEKKYLDGYYSTIGSRKNAYSKYRMRVENSNLNDEIKNIVKNILRLSKEERDQFKLNDKLQINFDHLNLRTIKDVEKYIEMGVSLIKKPSYIDKILGFCCVTGRRPAEIGCSSDFSFIDSNHLIFDGQLKTKGSNSLKSYKIPVLMNINDFLIHWRFFREQYTKNLIDRNIYKLDDFFSTQLTEKFHNNYSKDMSMRVKKYFKNFVTGEIQTKNLRPIYATIAVNKFNKNSNKSSQKYIAEILGHSDNDLNTTNSYIDFKNI
jgi:hypothetical protein